MTTYTCPHHPEVVSDKPGKCPKCGGMDLILAKKADSSGQGGASQQEKSFLKTYKPLLIIIGMILLPVVVLAIFNSNFDWRQSMAQFMAGFFLVFSGFKLLDLSGFAEGYSTYDLLARRWRTYGYIYPFLELGLGLSYLLGPSPTTLWATIGLMTLSGVGVVLEVAKGKKVNCVCLGTVIDVPLTTVTIIEDFGMAAMALVMLFA